MAKMTFQIHGKNMELKQCQGNLLSCLTFWKAMACSPPGSFVHGILQARILEWVTMIPNKWKMLAFFIPD